MGRIISVVSGKGGVGKSTVALNLACALSSKFNSKVALVDLNLTTPHIAAMSGIGPSAKTLEDVVSGKSTLGDALFLHESGAAILPSSISPKPLTSFSLGRIGPVLRQLKRSFDYVIVDSGPGLGRESMLALRYGDDLLFVSTPTLPALMDVLRCRRAVRNLGKNHLGLVLNMIAKDEAQLSANQASALAGMPVIASIPRHKSVPISLAYERAVIRHDTYSPASASFFQIGALISGKQYSAPKRGLIANIVGRLLGRA